MLKFYKIDDLKYFTDYAVAWRGSIQSKDRATGRINPAEAYRILLELGNCNIATGNNTSIAADLTGAISKGCNCNH